MLFKPSTHGVIVSLNVVDNVLASDSAIPVFDNKVDILVEVVTGVMAEACVVWIAVLSNNG